jgi:two-component system chemotaxis response regulator CheB
VVAIVASVGGLAAISEVLGGLPAEFRAAVIVLQHLEAGRESLLPRILAGRTPLAVRPAASGDVLRAGHVYVAPAGRHLALAPDRTLRLGDGPRVHYVRPAADVLLNSLAEAGAPVIAVVLTGRGEDGARGALRVRTQGGTVLATDRGTSTNFGMPGAADDAGGVDEVLPLPRIAPRLVALVSQLWYERE